MTPLLTLVAPTGMTQAERTGWMHAAMKALDGISPGSLERGVREAFATVDHPSKIVPAIIRARDSGYKPLPQPREVVEEPVGMIGDLTSGLGARVGSRYR